MRIVVVVCMVLALGATARAEQYFVSYEADGVLPEADGWTRYTSGGGAERYFEDGALVIDSRASTTISDAYAWWRPGQLDPEEPNEFFVVQWRLLVSELQGPWDPTLGIYSDDRRGIGMDFTTSGVHVPGIGIVATFEPGVYHEFEFRSADMLSFDLFVDMALAYSGQFMPPALGASFVAWGDGTLGGASLASWDYFRFGVIVPEARSFWLVLFALLASLNPRG